MKTPPQEGLNFVAIDFETANASRSSPCAIGVTVVESDLGNYERYLDANLTSDHVVTTGKVYGSVIEKERAGNFLGKTVQIIPHITNEIKSMISNVGIKAGADVTIVELGGTVGDIESMPFLEAARQMHAEMGHDNFLFVHTTLVPVLGKLQEQKTKPTQHSVRELRAQGIQPDVIVAKSEKPLEDAARKKFALFCDVPLEAVVSQIALKQAGVKVGSSGLGLAFCRMAVEAHGGHIWVESEGEGKGATFVVALPC